MRASEWALREHDRRESERLASERRSALAEAAAGASSRAGPREPAGETPAAPVTGIRGALLGTRRRSLVTGLLCGALGATAVALLGDSFRAEPAPPPSAAPSSAAPTFSPPAEGSAALRRFTQGNRREATFPPLLGATFTADAVANVYVPLPGVLGPRIYATRWSEEIACLVLVTTNDRVAVSCGTVEELEDTGLYLDAYLPNALTDPLDIGLLTAGTLPDEPSIIHVHWRPDGTFGIEDRPVRAFSPAAP